MITYAELVDLAFAAHNPTWVAHKEQYASVMLAHDAEQLAVAEERAARFSAMLGSKPLATRIEPLKRFWNAEDYHQKYHLRNDRVLSAEFRAMFGDDETALRESTAAARVNGYVAGNGTREQLSREMEFLGLTVEGRSKLVSFLTRPGDGIGCSAG